MIPPFQLLQADYPSTILEALHNSTDILGDVAEKLQISDADNPRIS